MKINCGPTFDERRDARRERVTQWHTIFALRPRRIDEDNCVWLEKIERRGTYHPASYGGDSYYTWEYKEL